MRVVAFLQPGMADWESGFVLAYVREYLGAEVLVATPDGKSVTSIGGLRISADTAFDTVDIDHAQALLLIGGGAWVEFQDEPFFAFLRAAQKCDTVISGICAGTLPLARAGLLHGRAHTSNSRGWLRDNAPDYQGCDLYRDVPFAVRDGRIVTAAGPAPVTFAAEIARLLAPERAAEADAFIALCAQEFTASTVTPGHA
jgi:putative intracellular protease/amidase